MTGINAITQKILDESKQEADALLIKAREEAESIHADFERQKEAKKQEIMGAAAREAEELSKRLKSVAELEFRKEILAAKQSVIENVFDMVMNKIDTIPADQYFELLSEMIVASVKKGNEAIILSANDRLRLPKDFLVNLNCRIAAAGIPGILKLSQESRNIRSGFILVSETMELNQTFEAIIKMKREELEAEVVRILFSSDLR